MAAAPAGRPLSGFNELKNRTTVPPQPGLGEILMRGILIGNFRITSSYDSIMNLFGSNSGKPILQKNQDPVRKKKSRSLLRQKIFNRPLTSCSKFFNRPLIAFSGPSRRRTKFFVACTGILSDNYPIIVTSTDTP
jgi:hypothetical protein